MSKPRGYLFIGGPAHGRWIPVPEGQQSIRVPEPVPPTIWREGDELYPWPKEHVYRIKSMYIFDRLAWIMVKEGLSREEESEALADVLLSPDGKEVRQ